MYSTAPKHHRACSINRKLPRLEALSQYLESIQTDPYLSEIDLSDLGLSDEELAPLIYLLDKKPEIASKITRLILCGNKLIKIPNLKSLTALRSLNISYNQLIGPLDLSGSLTLLDLVLSGNKLRTPINLILPATLQNLTLSHNLLINLPNIIGPIALRTLDLSNNHLTGELNFTTYPELYYLYLDENLLYKLPILSGMLKLKILSLSNNKLTNKLYFKDLPSLEQLHLKSNLLTNKPNFIGVNKLNSLYLDENLLHTELDFTDLPTLSCLSLNCNVLPIPPKLTGLKNLSRLELNNNLLFTLPNVSELPKLNNLGSNYVFSYSSDGYTTASRIILAAEENIRDVNFYHQTYSYVPPTIPELNEGIFDEHFKKILGTIVPCRDVIYSKIVDGLLAKRVPQELITSLFFYILRPPAIELAFVSMNYFQDVAERLGKKTNDYSLQMILSEYAENKFKVLVREALERYALLCKNGGYFQKTIPKMRISI